MRTYTYAETWGGADAVVAQVDGLLRYAGVSEASLARVLDAVHQRWLEQIGVYLVDSTGRQVVEVAVEIGWASRGDSVLRPRLSTDQPGWKADPASELRGLGQRLGAMAREYGQSPRLWVRFTEAIRRDERLHVRLSQGAGFEILSDEVERQGQAETPTDRWGRRRRSMEASGGLSVADLLARHGQLGPRSVQAPEVGPTLSGLTQPQATPGFERVGETPPPSAEPTGRQGIPPQASIDPSEMTIEMEPVQEEESHKRRRVDHTLARFSAVHDGLREEDERRAQRQKLPPWSAISDRLDGLLVTESLVESREVSASPRRTRGFRRFLATFGLLPARPPGQQGLRELQEAAVQDVASAYRDVMRELSDLLAIHAQASLQAGDRR